MFVYLYIFKTFEIYFLFLAPAPKGSSPQPTDAKTLNATRRRLSVMSDNKLVEGMDAVAIDAADDAAEVCVFFKMFF